MFSGFGEGLKKLQANLPNLNDLQKDDEDDPPAPAQVETQTASTPVPEQPLSEPGGEDEWGWGDSNTKPRVSVDQEAKSSGQEGAFFGFAPSFGRSRDPESAPPSPQKAASGNEDLDALRMELEETKSLAAAESEQRRAFQAMIRTSADRQVMTSALLRKA